MIQQPLIRSARSHPLQGFSFHLRRSHPYAQPDRVPLAALPGRATASIIPPAAGASKKVGSLDYYAISSSAPEGFRCVHLFGFRGWYGEITWGRSPRHVTVLIHAFPEKGRECFGAVVPQVLMLEPISGPVGP